MGVGMVRVWKHVLTVSPPLGTGGVVLLLPYVLMFLGAVIAVTVSLRARKLYYLSLVVPVLVLIAAILFSTHIPVLAGVLGVLGVLITTTWAAWRAGRLEPARVLAVVIVLDRKSTRLNSSHVAISYAVFCLKKKNLLIHDKRSEKQMQSSRLMCCSGAI